MRTAKQHNAIVGWSLGCYIALKRNVLCGCAIWALALIIPSPLNAAQPRGLFGTVGLIDMPSARMAPSGELGASAAFFDNSQRYTLSFQALPWLETSFRYTGLAHFNPDYPVYYDRAFGVKVRLWDEGNVLPALVIGTNDLVGTGVYSGEYLAATKQIGPVDATLGIGWGRLATANTFRNPFSLVSGSFDNRDSNYGQGGTFNFGQYFHGNKAGIFAGLAWNTPIENLKFIAEYSSDRYAREAITGNFTPRHQFNFGLSYSPTESIVLGLNWQYGRAVSGTFTFALDPTEDGFPQRLGPTPPPPRMRTPEEQSEALREMVAQRENGGRPTIGDTSLADILWHHPDIQDVAIQGDTLQLRMRQTRPAECTELARTLAPHAAGMLRIVVNESISCGILAPLSNAFRVEKPQTYRMAAAENFVTIDASRPARPSRTMALANIRRAVRAQNIQIVTLSMNGGEAVIYYRNLTYLTEKDCIDRLLRVLMAESPSEIERFRLISMSGDLPQIQLDIPRGTAERGFEQEGAFDFMRDANIVTPVPMEDLAFAQATKERIPRLSWSIYPQFRQQLFDPVNPVGIQLLVGADFALSLLPGLHLNGAVEFNLYNNFNVARASDSVLPHVRTDFVKYFAEGKNGIGMLYVQRDFRWASDTFVSLRGGYLESMFSGIGGEVLWRPKGQRWALGMDAYYVRQRKFDRLFGLQSYTQATGHLSLYYDAPWYDLSFQVRFGRYLAGDWGSTIQVTRRFASGIEIGAFATKTNVTSERFGEGSFDKGIIIRLPLASLMPVNTQRMFAMDLRPVQRDGGQTLWGDAQLFDRMRRTSEGDLWRQAHN